MPASSRIFQNMKVDRQSHVVDLLASRGNKKCVLCSSPTSIDSSDSIDYVGPRQNEIQEWIDFDIQNEVHWISCMFVRWKLRGLAVVTSRRRYTGVLKYHSFSLQNEATTKICSNSEISLKTPNDIVTVNVFVFQEGTMEDFAFIGSHEKSIVSVHALVQSERLGFHTALLVDLLPMRYLTVPWAIFNNFASATATHVWKNFGTFGTAIVTRIRGVVVVLAHHGCHRLDDRGISSFKRKSRDLGSPFASSESLRSVDSKQVGFRHQKTKQVGCQKGREEKRRKWIWKSRRPEFLTW